MNGPADIAISKESVGLSVHPLKHYSFMLYFCLRVKVFTLKFIRPHILKTLWWISFIFGMMVDIGLKFLLAPSPSRGWSLGQGHGLPIFIKMSKFLCLSFYSCIIKTLVEFHLYLTCYYISTESLTPHDPHPGCDRGQGHKLRSFI